MISGMISSPRAARAADAFALNTPTIFYRQGWSAAAALLALLIQLSYTAMAAAQSPRAARETPGSTGQNVESDRAIAVEITDMSVTQAGVALTLSSTSDEEGTQQDLHLMIGPMEGQAIVRALRHAMLPRPMTHDLMKTLLERDGWRVKSVIIRDLRENTFFADLIMERHGAPGSVEERTIDARPSDAMALGLRFDAKIFVRQKVFDLERERLEEESPKKKEDQPGTLTI